MRLIQAEKNLLRKATLLIALLVLSLCNDACFLLTGKAWAKLRSSGHNTVEPAKDNFALGMTKFKEHDYDGATDAFLQAVYFSRNSYNPDAYYWLGLSYQEKNQDAKAIEALKKCLEQAISSMPEAHLHLAQIYLRNNRLDETEFEATKALVDLHGPAAQARNILGLAAQRRGDLERAKDQFLEALGDPPWRYTEAWMNYAENLMKQKEWGLAVNQLHAMLNHDKALKGLQPQRIYLDIGICLLAKGDHQGAMDNWHEVLNYNPDNADAHLQLAMLLDSERHISAAVKEYKEYIRLSPSNAETAKIKNRVLLLEQSLRANPSTSEKYYSPLPTQTIDENNEHTANPDQAMTESENRQTRNPKKDVLEPKGGKESGF